MTRLSVIAVLASTVVCAATTNFFENFESGLTNWVVGDGNPAGTAAYWGVVNSAFGGEGTHSGSFKAYCAATGFASSASTPEYRDGMSAYLIRTVDLSGYTNATLSFWYKIPSIETDYDYARVLIGNNALWSSDRPKTSWTLVTLSLESFIGTTQSLKFEFVTDGSVTEEGWYLDDITITDVATPAPPPPNDNFDSAQQVVGSTGSAGASNRGATSQVNEPDPGNSIWFRWTPFTNGIVTFRTGGSAFDTALCIYTGNSLVSLVRVACDENGDTNNGGRISFNASMGTTYFISVRGSTGASGFVLLNWEQPNGLGADRLPDLFVWVDAANDYLYGWYLDQSEPTQPGRTLLRVSTATPNIGAGPLELHGSSTTPGVSQRIFRTDGSYYERFAGNFTFHPGHGHLHFDNWINLHLRAVLPNDAVGDIIASGDKTSFAIIDLTRYDGSLPGSPESSQYGGGLLQGLSVGWADVYTADLPDQWIDVTDVPSGRYWLEGIVDPANSILESNETNNSARILIEYLRPSNEPPSNDHFINALAIAGLSGGDIAENLRATREIGEPAHYLDSEATRSLWWRWIAPSNMNAVISTDGSDFDTVLAVYLGTNVGELTQLASDDDSGFGNNSRVVFAATAGITYRIAVDGFVGDAGNIQLNINPALNDHFANSLSITGVSGSTSGSTRGASRQVGEPNHGGINGSASIWYSWVAPLSGPFTFDTSGSGFDTLLGVYTGSAVNALITIASDNNSGSNGASRVTFNAISNTTYRIAIDGSTVSGVAKLAWSGPAAPTIATQPNSTNAPAGATVAFRVTALGSTPLAYQWRHQGTNLFDGDYVTGANTDTLTLSKIQFARAGVYSVVITNAYGAVTSAPANLIVLDNPRVVFVHESFGHSGASVRVPVEMQSLGNEHAVSFSLIFDPALLSSPRVTNLPVGAVVSLNTNQTASGILGVTLTLPSGATFATGHVTTAEFVFNTAPTLEPIDTFAGFGTAPVPRTVTDTNGLVLPALFVAGVIELSPLRIISGSRSNGSYGVSFTTGAGHHGAGDRYAVDASEDLSNWTPLTTNTASGGLFQFNDTSALPYRFYRVRIVP